MKRSARRRKPEITHPNIRFQQTRELPRELHRTDSMPLIYVKKQEADKSRYHLRMADRPLERQWNLKKLSSR